MQLSTRTRIIYSLSLAKESRFKISIGIVDSLFKYPTT